MSEHVLERDEVETNRVEIFSLRRQVAIGRGRLAPIHNIEDYRASSPKMHMEADDHASPGDAWRGSAPSDQERPYRLVEYAFSPQYVSALLFPAERIQRALDRLKIPIVEPFGIAAQALEAFRNQQETLERAASAMMRLTDPTYGLGAAGGSELRTDTPTPLTATEGVSMLVTPIVEPRRKAERLLVELIQRLSDLHDLDGNWDSYGALPISQRAEAVTRELLVAFWNAGLIPDDPDFDLMPVPTGGLQLEWTGNNGELEIEIRSNGSLSILRVLPGGELVHSLSDPEPDLDAMKSLISEVLG